MEAIPLLCKICPKQPHFSDISHLLTHINSKGHLAHYFNAKIRAREDKNIRQQFDDFNAWNERYGIEKLLSERKVQKDAKNKRTKARAPQDTASRGTKPAKRARRKSIVSPDGLDEGDLKDTIDPRLSQPQGPGGLPQLTGNVKSSQSPPPFDMISLHRTRGPRTRSCTPSSTRHCLAFRPNNCSFGDRVPKSDTDTDDIINWTGSPSPAKTSYPDPSVASQSFPFGHDITPTPTQKDPTSATGSPVRSSEASPQTSESSASHLIKLKGPQWPGMALFDSASPRAQRMRNQKKEYSMLEQMKQNSIVVQPIERIFFPEGTLKKERPITGNVESSPLMEPTPKPKRRRQKNSRAVLGDLSTNIPKARARKPTKRTASDTVSEDFGLANPFGQSPVSDQPATSHIEEATGMRLDPGDHEQSNEWRLNMGLPDFADHHAFSVYQDPMEVEPTKQYKSAMQQPATVYFPFLQLPNFHSISHRNVQSYPLSSRYPSGHSTNRSAPKTADQCRGICLSNSVYPTWDRSPWDSRTIGATKENIEPLHDTSSHTNEEAPQVGAQRVTQRYFSVTGNNPPRFYDTLPSQTDFGGFGDHAQSGSSLNPLNLQYLQEQSELQGLNYPFGTPLLLDEDYTSSYNLESKTKDQVIAHHMWTAPKAEGMPTRPELSNREAADASKGIHSS